MIRKNTLFILDGSATYQDIQRGILRALDDQTSVIQVLTPFDLSTVVKVTYLIKGAENDTVTQYIPSTTLKGSDVLDSTHVVVYRLDEVNDNIQQVAIATISQLMFHILL